MSSIRDRIAASNGTNAVRITVPEWDGVELEIRAITLKQHSDLLAVAMPDGKTVDMGIMVPRLLILSVYDPENGEQVFTDDDEAMLGDLGAGAVERLGFAAMRVSGLDGAAVESGKDGS